MCTNLLTGQHTYGQIYKDLCNIRFKKIELFKGKYRKVAVTVISMFYYYKRAFVFGCRFYVIICAC